MGGAAAGALIPGASTAEEPAAGRPNVLVIVLDDLGYSDLGYYGSEIRTPNIDALARSGTAFNQFYPYPLCSPSRAALLTGRAPHEMGLAFLTSPAGAPVKPGPYQGYLTPGASTLASVLKTAGYATYMSGKWHLGEAPEHWPRHYGFDRYFGLISGASSYFKLRQQPGAMPRIMALDDRPWTPPDDGSFYMTDAITDAAVGDLRDHAAARSRRPFFLYLAYTAPHWPLNAPEADIRSYDGVYAQGWDAIRQARVARLRARGFDPREFPMAAPPKSVGAWADYPDKAVWRRKMQTYAGMVSHADRGIGKVLAELRRTGALDNTLVFVMSDNGASAESVEGRRLNDASAPIGSPDSYVSLEAPGAFVANTPFRDFKGTTYEGGIRAPLIAVLPGAAKTTRVDRDSIVSILDIMPTVLEFTRTSPPDAAALEGQSIASSLRRGATVPARPVYIEHIGWRAMRDGRWKLVSPRGKPWELYDLATDPAESHDLAADHPEVVQEMSRRWQAWAARVGARPPTMDEIKFLVPVHDAVAAHP